MQIPHLLLLVFALGALGLERAPHEVELIRLDDEVHETPRHLRRLLDLQSALVVEPVRRERPREAAHDDGEHVENARELPLRAPSQTHGDVVGRRRREDEVVQQRDGAQHAFDCPVGCVRNGEEETYDAGNVLGL